MLACKRTVSATTNRPSMASIRALLAVLGFLTSLITVLGQDSPSDWPRHDNGLNDVVEWFVERVSDQGPGTHPVV